MCVVGIDTLFKSVPYIVLCCCPHHNYKYSDSRNSYCMFRQSHLCTHRNTDFQLVNITFTLCDFNVMLSITIICAFDIAARLSLVAVCRTAFLFLGFI